LMTTAVRGSTAPLLSVDVSTVDRFGTGCGGPNWHGCCLGQDHDDLLKYLTVPEGRVGILSEGGWAVRTREPQLLCYFVVHDILCCMSHLVVGGWGVVAG
jgi:hypothetical protein